MYRPFDQRWIYYQDNVVFRSRKSVMGHLGKGPNLGLVFSRQAVAGEAGYNHVLVTSYMFDNRGFYSNKGISQIAPVYLYPEHEADQSDAFAPKQRTPNLDPKLYAAICAAAGIDPADQAGPDDDFRAATGDARPSEVKVFDYIYGVLHSPEYRATYAEFLKIDFPRIPYPASAEVFAHVSEKGEALRRLHLMEAPAIGETPYPFMGDGDDVVAAGYPKHSEGKVHINPDQHFDAVPETAWNFHIGGYQPAQKWLKDRRGRVLSYDDIGHYQRIIKILIETDRIMKEIELPL
jgi:predicted helicase